VLDSAVSAARAAGDAHKVSLQTAAKQD
jgi:hypothetical protein